MTRSRVWLGGLAALVVAVCGLFGMLAASNGASKPVAASAPALGSVTSVAVSARKPVGARLVLIPLVTYNVRASAVRALRARGGRVSARFVARIVIRPRRGRARTLLVLRRSRSGLSLRTSPRWSILGASIPFRRFVLSRAQTALVKRAARRGALMVRSRARYVVRYKNAQSRTVARAGVAWGTNLPLSLRAPRLGGANLHRLDVALRRVIRQVQRSRMACVTRNLLVERLRITAGVLASGNRSAAAGLLTIWIKMAGSMRAAGVLSADQARMLRTGLRPVLRRVGAGASTRRLRTRRWPALPRCAPGAHTAQTSGSYDTGKIVEAVIWAGVRAIPKAGKYLAPLVKILWPDNTSATINNAIDQAMSANAIKDADDALNSLHRDVGLFSEKEVELGPSDPLVNSYFASTHESFADNLSAFTSSGYEVELLPLYAQYVNMYLAFMRDAVIEGPNWGWSQAAIDSAEADISQAGRAIPAGIPDATTYTNNVYKAGLDEQDSLSDTVSYQRESQLHVLDYQATWKFLDPMTYPYGDPTFRLTRMIYSDLVGTLKTSFAAPANVDHPLTSITAWKKFMSGASSTPSTTSQWFMDAIKADNAPLTGAVTGDTRSTGDTPPAGGKSGTITWPRTDSEGRYYGGAIVDAKGYTVLNARTIARIDLTFSSGLTDHFGSTESTQPPQDFTYPDETLQAVKIMGGWQPNPAPYPNQWVGDSLQFGFKYSDSFYPSGEVHSVGDKCLDLPGWADWTQAVINTCRSTPSEAQDWTYNSSSHELTSSGSGAASGGPKCLDAYSGDTAPGTGVIVYHCNGTASQQWMVSSDGVIMNLKSWLCMEPAGGSTADNTKLQLNTCNGTAAQRWSSPWTARLPGTIRAPNTKQCLDVTGGSRANGTTLQMYTCNGLWAQGWYYDDKPSDVDGTPATNQLQVYAGTKCMVGGAYALHVPIADCDGSDAQRWTVNADGTIRPMIQPAGGSPLCLDRANGLTANGTAVQLIPCVADNRAQQWTWPVGSWLPPS